MGDLARQAQFEALATAAAAAQEAADYATLRQKARELSELGRAHGDVTVVAWGDYFMGIALIVNNEGGPASRALRRAAAVFRDAGDEVMTARSMMNIAMIEMDINLNSSEARRLYEEAAPAIRDGGDRRRLAILYGNLGEVCRLDGDYDAALRHAREAERLFREVDEPGYAMWQLANIAHYKLLRRDYGAAIESMREAYELLRRAPTPHWIALYFDVWIIIAAKLDRWETAAQLLGYVDRLRSERNVPRLAGMMPWLSSPMERLASTIPQDRLHELFGIGEDLTVETAQNLVSDITPPR